PRSAPGSPTLVRPVRMGDWPVMKAARPAVQLCCPYQSVKSAPSLATRSMLGVRYPMVPWLYALTLNQPMSSPQIMRILGFVAAAMIALPAIVCVTGQNRRQPKDHGKLSDVPDDSISGPESSCGASPPSATSLLFSEEFLFDQVPGRNP